MKKNAKKEKTKCDGRWEKAEFIKQVDVGHFTAFIQKAYKNTTNTHTHKVFSHQLTQWMAGSGVKDNEW